MKWPSVDAAEFVSDFGLRYRVGLFDGCTGWVYDCPDWVINQQVAELYGVWILVRLWLDLETGGVCQVWTGMYVTRQYASSVEYH